MFPGQQKHLVKSYFNLEGLRSSHWEFSAQKQKCFFKEERYLKILQIAVSIFKCSEFFNVVYLNLLFHFR